MKAFALFCVTFLTSWTTWADTIIYSTDFDSTAPSITQATPTLTDPGVITATSGGTWYSSFQDVSNHKGDNFLTDGKNELSWVFNAANSGGYRSAVFALDETLFSQGPGTYSFNALTYDNNTDIRQFVEIYAYNGSASVTMSAESWNRQTPLAVSGTGALIGSATAAGSTAWNPNNAGRPLAFDFNYSGSGDILVHLGGGRHNNSWHRQGFADVSITTAIPEPSAFMLFTMGVLGLLKAKRFKS